jgi:hypothetical protein
MTTPTPTAMCSPGNGGRARPMHPDWARPVHQCERTSTAFFFHRRRRIAGLATCTSQDQCDPLSHSGFCLDSARSSLLNCVSRCSACAFLQLRPGRVGAIARRGWIAQAEHAAESNRVAAGVVYLVEQTVHPQLVRGVPELTEGTSDVSGGDVLDAAGGLLIYQKVGVGGSRPPLSAEFQPCREVREREGVEATHRAYSERLRGDVDVVESESRDLSGPQGMDAVMSRTPSARTVAIRDQLLAIMRAAEHPLSTPQIHVRIATGGRNCNTPNGQCRNTGRCPGRCWCTSGPQGPPVYPQLCTLERLGLVARVHYANPDSITHAIPQGRLRQHLAGADSRAVDWRYVDTAADTAVNALLDALEDA